MTNKRILWAYVAAAILLTFLWSGGELTRSPRFVDEDINLVAGTMLLDSIVTRAPRGEIAAHSSPVTTGPLVTVPAAIAYRLSGDFRIARATKYGWAALMAAALVLLLLALLPTHKRPMWAAAVPAIATISLFATPHLNIEVPQLLGETAAIALLLLALAAYARARRHRGVWAGLLLGLAVATKMIIAPAAALMLIFLAAFDRRALLAFLATIIAVWATYTGMQAWQTQASLVEMLSRQIQMVQGGSGSGLAQGAVVTRGLLERFGALEYKDWPGFLQLHLWTFGLSGLILGGIALWLVRPGGPRSIDAQQKVVAATLAAFVLGEWLWFTWINDTMWIRHAVIAWAMFSATLGVIVTMSRSKLLIGLALVLLGVHMVLGRAWVTAPRHVLPLAAREPAIWWEGAGASPCSWQEISCTSLPVSRAAGDAASAP